MEIFTSRFGSLNIPEETMVTFPSGLIGFNQYPRYALLRDERGLGYQWLQSMDDGNLAFVVMEPGLIKADYQIEIPDDALGELEFREGDALTIFAIVTIPPGHPERATANLQGPLVINESKRKGKQVILNESYPIQHALISGEKATRRLEKPTEEVVTT